jgi:hypothetical protein
LRERARPTPTVARLVEVKLDAFAPQIDDVVHAGTINVCQLYAALVEEVGRVESGRIVHRHFRAEAPVAQIRPVRDLAVANAHEIGQPIARHVSQED